MISVGDIITAPSGENWRITGIDHNGRFVASPVAFGSPVSLTDALLTEFGIEGATTPPAVDEIDGWKALADAERLAEAAKTDALADGLLTPEDVFDSHRLGPSGK